MRTPIPAGSIVVGVDGSMHADRAVTWAARQAIVEGRAVDLVYSSDRAGLPGVDDEGQRELHRALRAGAEAVLDASRSLAAAQAPQVPVRLHLVEEDARSALIEASRTAHLVVVGSRGRGPVRTLLLGSVSHAVARLAACPVVVCRPPGPGHEQPEIIVGADGTAASIPVIEFAFRQASLRGLPLVVMHCFFDVVLAAQSNAALDPAPEPSDVDDLRLLLAESVAGMREKFPDVEVDLRLAQGLVDQCLLDNAPRAELLVVGRSDPHGWSRFMNASCALAVLERATTTVAVVPEHAYETRKHLARTD